MKAIFIFLFALFSLTKSANVYELELNKVYDLDVKKYKEGYIPSGTVNYFKVPVEEDDVLALFNLESENIESFSIFNHPNCTVADIFLHPDYPPSPDAQHQ